MRHLGSIVLAIVFAALSYALAGYGQIKFVSGTATGKSDWTFVGFGIAALAIAGVLYAVLVMARISPLGPFIAGAAYIAAELWYALDQSSLVKLLGTSILNQHLAQEAPLSGLALFAAIPLVATIFSPRRWRGKEGALAPAADGAAPEYSTDAVSAAPSYAPAQTTPETASDSTSDDSADTSKAEGGDAAGADAKETAEKK